MMIEQASVIDYQNGIATIQCFAKAGCGGCAAQTGCGTRALSGLAGEKRAPQLTLAVTQPLQAGDRIEIGITEQHLLFGMLWLYGLPLLVLLASALVVSQWLENELVILLAMIFTTSTTFLWVKKQIKKSHPEAFTPVFVRKL